MKPILFSSLILAVALTGCTDNSKVDAAKKENAKLKKSNKDLNAEAEAIKNKVKQLEAELKDYNSQLAGAKEREAFAVKTIANYEAKINKLKNKIQSQELTIKEYKELESQIKAELQAASLERQKYENLKKEAEDLLENAKVEQAKASADLEIAKKEFEKLSQEREELKTEDDARDAKIKAEDEKRDKEISQKLAENLQTLNELQTENAKKTQLVDDLTNLNEETKKLISKNEKKINEMNDLYETLISSFQYDYLKDLFAKWADGTNKTFVVSYAFNDLKMTEVENLRKTIKETNLSKTFKGMESLSPSLKTIQKMKENTASLIKKSAGKPLVESLLNPNFQTVTDTVVVDLSKESGMILFEELSKIKTEKGGYMIMIPTYQLELNMKLKVVNYKNKEITIGRLSSERVTISDAQEVNLKNIKENFIGTNGLSSCESVNAECLSYLSRSGKLDVKNGKQSKTVKELLAVALNHSMANVDLEAQKEVYKKEIKNIELKLIVLNKMKALIKIAGFTLGETEELLGVKIGSVDTNQTQDSASKQQKTTSDSVKQNSSVTFSEDKSWVDSAVDDISGFFKSLTAKAPVNNSDLQKIEAYIASQTKKKESLEEKVEKVGATDNDKLINQVKLELSIQIVQELSANRLLISDTNRFIEVAGDELIVTIPGTPVSTIELKDELLKKSSYAEVKSATHELIDSLK